MEDKNTRYTPTLQREDAFRREVRDILDVDIFTRDETIFDVIKRLKEQADVFIAAGKR